MLNVVLTFCFDHTQLSAVRDNTQLSAVRITLNSALSGTSCYANFGSKVHSYYWYKNKSRSFLIFAENICIDIPTIYIHHHNICKASRSGSSKSGWLMKQCHTSGVSPCLPVLTPGIYISALWPILRTLKRNFFCLSLSWLSFGTGVAFSVSCLPPNYYMLKKKQTIWLTYSIYISKVCCMFNKFPENVTLT